jgi:hypothetical protein
MNDDAIPPEEKHHLSYINQKGLPDNEPMAGQDLMIEHNLVKPYRHGTRSKNLAPSI